MLCGLEAQRARRGDGLAPRLTPPVRCPRRRTEMNTDACSDGACEVLVTSTADTTANGVSVHVTVADDSLIF
ncbi:hypothetical protein Sfulv_61800 [Streptomyces fulvorobeus]|uniref:Uncharacterized protein n=2 Tax=Streptomyces fulvorobeus TaxID=284028 RepID=A0A7J0CFU5_9ACTN|nr:hypothetical protein Sfulv_61800 [Streptomyces fulvorobeus]